MGIPVIDPLIGHSVNSTSLLLRAKMLVNKNHATCSFWQTLRDSTPPSSLDLEWEHEGLYTRFPFSLFHEFLLDYYLVGKKIIQLFDHQLNWI